MDDEATFPLSEGAYFRNGVLISADGHLFLAQGNHNVLDYATGRRSIARRSFSTFEQNILARHSTCQSIGTQYQHIIFPDKQSVLQTSFPVQGVVSLQDLFAAAC